MPSALDLPLILPKSKNARIRVFTHSNMILLLQYLVNLMFSWCNSPARPLK